MAESGVRLLQALDQRVGDRVPGSCPVLVQASVRVAHARLAGARITDFVPVLVERAAVDRLRRLAD